MPLEQCSRRFAVLLGKATTSHCTANSGRTAAQDQQTLLPVGYEVDVIR